MHYLSLPILSLFTWILYDSILSFLSTANGWIIFKFTLQFCKNKNEIINVLRIKSAGLFCPLFHFSGGFSLPSCGLHEHFFLFHFDLLIILLNTSLCTYFVVVALGITLYIHYLLQSALHHFTTSSQVYKTYLLLGPFALSTSFDIWCWLILNALQFLLWFFNFFLWSIHKYVLNFPNGFFLSFYDWFLMLLMVVFWSEHLVCMLLILWHMTGPALWPSMWSVFII